MAGIAAKGEKRAADLTRTRRWIILIIVSIGSSMIYSPMYIKYTFPVPLREGLGMTNTQTGTLLTFYALTATICYLPSGLVADRVRMRTLASVGFIGTAILVYIYAMLPSYGVLQLIFVAAAVTSILIWWGVRFKLVRLISGEDGYSRNIGISYGLYGAAGLIVGLVDTWIFGALAAQTALSVALVIGASIILALGILSIIFVPKFEGELSRNTSVKSVLRDAGKSLANPVVILCAVTMFFVYFFYTCTSYTASYMPDALNASGDLTNIVSIVRQAGVALIAAPVFGFLAGRAKRVSGLIWIGSVLAAIGFAVLAIVPASSGIVIAVAILAIALGFVASGVYGIVSAQLTEGKVVPTMFGAAAGVVSLVGFLPDTISGPWLGSIIDKQGAAGYPTVFWILCVVAVIAALAAIGLSLYVKSHKAKLDAAYEAAELEAKAAAETNSEVTA